MYKNEFTLSWAVDEPANFCIDHTTVDYRQQRTYHLAIYFLIRQLVKICHNVLYSRS